jgi:hypothetical protein
MSTEGVDARALAVLMEAKMRAYSACVMKPIPQPANTDYAKGGVAGNAWIGVSCWRCFVVRCCFWLGKLRVGVVHACPRQSQSKAIPHGCRHFFVQVSFPGDPPPRPPNLNILAFPFKRLRSEIGIARIINDESSRKCFISDKWISASYYRLMRWTSRG